MGRPLTVRCIAGETHNYLTLKELVYIDRRRYWICQCEFCNQVTQPIREYKIAKGKAKGCGKCAAERHRTQKSKCWKGCGEISGEQMAYMRHQAKLRKIQFQVSLEYLWNLFLAQAGKCALTGVPIVFKCKREKRQGEEQTASLDRIDSDKEYEPGNVCWVHKDVNRMKREYPLERYIEICEKVARHINSQRMETNQPDYVI